MKHKIYRNNKKDMMRFLADGFSASFVTSSGTDGATLPILPGYARELVVTKGSAVIVTNGVRTEKVDAPENLCMNSGAGTAGEMSGDAAETNSGAGTAGGTLKLNGDDSVQYFGDFHGYLANVKEKDGYAIECLELSAERQQCEMKFQAAAQAQAGAKMQTDAQANAAAQAKDDERLQNGEDPNAAAQAQAQADAGSRKCALGIFCVDGYAVAEAGGESFMLNPGEQLFLYGTVNEIGEAGLMGGGHVIKLEVFYDQAEFCGGAGAGAVSGAYGSAGAGENDAAYGSAGTGVNDAIDGSVGTGENDAADGNAGTGVNDAIDGSIGTGENDAADGNAGTGVNAAIDADAEFAGKSSDGKNAGTVANAADDSNAGNVENVATAKKNGTAANARKSNGKTKEKLTVKDFFLAMAISVTNLRVAEKIIPFRKNNWFDEELFGAIRRVSGKHIAALTWLVMLMCVCAAKGREFVYMDLIWAVVITAVVNVVLVMPVIYAFVLPRPVGAHIKKRADLTDEEKRIQERRDNEVRRKKRALKRY